MMSFSSVRPITSDGRSRRNSMPPSDVVTTTSRDGGVRWRSLWRFVSTRVRSGMVGAASEGASGTPSAAGISSAGAEARAAAATSGTVAVSLASGMRAGAPARDVALGEPDRVALLPADGELFANQRNDGRPSLVILDDQLVHAVRSVRPIFVTLSAWKMSG